MIISCDKCSKKFEISDNLIPDQGRLLQCGSCSYQWHYVPVSRLKLTKEVKVTDSHIKTKKISDKQKTKKIKKTDINSELNSPKNNKETSETKKNVGFLSYLLVIIISFIALIIIIDTFKSLLVSFIPGIDFYISSLYESLKDIFLFFIDLIK